MKLILVVGENTNNGRARMISEALGTSMSIEKILHSLSLSVEQAKK